MFTLYMYIFTYITIYTNYFITKKKKKKHISNTRTSAKLTNTLSLLFKSKILRLSNREERWDKIHERDSKI